MSSLREGHDTEPGTCWWGMDEQGRRDRSDVVCSAEQEEEV